MALLLLFFAGCSEIDDDSYSPYDSVYSDNTEVSFEELLLLVNFRVKTDDGNDSLYLVVNKMEKIVIKVNNKVWAEFSSDTFDNQGIATIDTAHLRVSNEKVSYLVVTGQTRETDGAYTAGDFSDYLNGFAYLSPGDYVCEIAEIGFLNSNNEKVVVKPHIYTYFEILPETKTLYLGEYTIDVNL